MQQIQPYDMLMLAVLVGAMLFGIWKGMAWEVASLASVFVSGAVAVSGNRSLAPHIDVPEPWNRILAMLILYVASAAAIWFVFHLVSKLIDRVHLKEFDRQLGGLCGLVKGVIYCVLITFFAVMLSEPARQAILVSRSGDYISRTIHRATPILPDEIRNVLGKYLNEFDAKLNAPLPQPRSESPMMVGQSTSESGLLSSGQNSNGAGGAPGTFGAGGESQTAPSETHPLLPEPSPKQQQL